MGLTDLEDSKPVPPVTMELTINKRHYAPDDKSSVGRLADE